MEYIKEINMFFDWLESNPMKSSSIVLWFALMNTANKARWPMDFSVAISTLRSKTGCTKDQIYAARNQLQQKGRISFRQRPGNQSAVYQLIPFVSEIETQSTTQTTTQIKNYEFVSEIATQSATQTPTQSATQTPNIIRLDKTRLDNLESAYAPPTIDEITAYCLEHGYRAVNPQLFFDYYEANGWRIGKNPMKDWRAAVRTWERRGFSGHTPVATTATSAESSLDLYKLGELLHSGTS